MANVSGILYTILTADSDVTAICSTRIYPLTIPQTAALPAVRIVTVAVAPTTVKNNASKLDAIRVQIDSYSPSMLTAQQLDETVRQTIDRYRGSVTVSGTGGATYFVDGIMFESRNETVEEEKDIFRVSSDYQVRIHRTP
jgi:hypothetical protein